MDIPEWQQAENIHTSKPYNKDTINDSIKPRINNDQLSNSLSRLVIYVHVLSLRNIAMRLNTCSMIETVI